ncbi:MULTISPECIES: hypothetical protein [unclassified Paenibacillus]|uniref:hypothetical protein n=1 Tax=unclassified Paenibacillus TaxID=185978 RepID=UPI0009A72AC3|nr:MULTISPECIES: hypothetical protein [unclassified Paenibacillus]
MDRVVNSVFKKGGASSLLSRCWHHFGFHTGMLHELIKQAGIHRFMQHADIRNRGERSDYKI